MAKFRQEDLTWFKIRSQVSRGEVEVDILEISLVEVNQANISSVVLDLNNNQEPIILI